MYTTYRLIGYLCVLCLATSTIWAQSFNHLKTLKTPAGTLRYNAEVTRIINRPDPSLSEFTPFGEPILVLAETELDRKTAKKYLIAYDPGPSDDPSYLVLDAANRKAIKVVASLWALNLVVASNGLLYTSGHTNTMYDKHCKYELERDTIVEVKQPFYYIGLASELYKPFTLYADREMTQPIAQLPKGSKVTVVLAEEYPNPDMPDYPLERFLFATPFGLTGWTRIESMQADGSDDPAAEYMTGVKGIYFAGD
ncbi:MAG: hypothetical protein IT273_04990 [Chitinophagales bacterium]|nr:hypothetical protein [Chitinophagales bacterium]